MSVSRRYPGGNASVPSAQQFPLKGNCQKSLKDFWSRRYSGYSRRALAMAVPAGAPRDTKAGLPTVLVRAEAPCGMAPQSKLMVNSAVAMLI